MASMRRPARNKKINPHFWVFCEGQTEEGYIKLLRAKYRIPIEIVPKVVGNRITDKFIKAYKKGKPMHEKDKNFLIYDADIHEVLERLKRIENTILIASNPSIELWFLLHYKNQTASISTCDCEKELKIRNRNEYKKGSIDAKLERKLLENVTSACNRAKKLKLYNNPSSNFHVFMKTLEEAKNNNNS